MLDLIRKHRGLFSVIFILAAAGMVVSMFGAPGRGSVGLASGVVAKVEGEEITSSELIDRLGQQTRQAEAMLDQQSQGNPETRKFLEQYVKAQVSPDRILQQLIQQKFLLTTAEGLGMHASVESIRDLIQKDPEFQSNGNFDPLVYKQRVSEPGMYEQRLAMQIKFMNLSRAFESGLAVVSPLEKENEAKLNTKYTFETLTVNPSSFPEPKSVSAEEVKAYLAKPTSITALQSYYERNKAQFESSEQVHARHILVRDSDGGEKKVKEIQAEIKAGKISFEEAAKKYSADKENAKKGGDLGFFAKEAMDPAFAQAAFALKTKDELSEPVKSSFGYHLIQFVDRKPALKKSFEEAKNEIAPKVLLEQLKIEKARAWVAQWTNSNKLPSEADAKKLGLTWSKQPEWSPLQDQLGNVGSVDAVMTELVTLNEAKRSLKNPITQGDRIILVKWISTKAGDANGTATTADAKNGPMTKDQEKSQSAFQFYLQSRFEDLEKKKKIVRSEKVLSQLRSQLQAGG